MQADRTLLSPNPPLCETPHSTSCHYREQEKDIMPLVPESPLLCVSTLNSRPWSVSVADGFRAEDGDERRHVPAIAFHVRVSEMKSLLSGSVEEWRLTVQCFLCHISTSLRLLTSIVLEKKKKMMSGCFSKLFIFRKFNWDMRRNHSNIQYGCAYILLIYYVAIVMQITQTSVVYNLYNDVYCCGLFNDVLWITQVLAIDEYVH